MAWRGRGAWLQYLDIPPLRIIWVDSRPIPSASAFVDYPEVVSMKMHGVSGREEVADDDLHRCILPKVVDVPLRVIGIRGIPEVCE